MTEPQLEALLSDIESDRSERKESAADVDKTICAFANDLTNHNAPGVVFVGVRDNGTCAAPTNH